MSHKKLWNAFYFCFGLIFLNLGIRTLVLNYCFDYQAFFVAVIALGFCGVFVAARQLLRGISVKNARIVFGVGLCLQMMVLVWMGVHLETTGNNDFGSVYHSAETWVLERRFPEIGYFAIYSNNMGAFFLLKDVFEIMHLLGWRWFFAGGLALNLISVLMAMIGVYCLAERMFGPKEALLSWGAFLLWPPLYFWVAVFYTDMLTLGFLPWVIYCCVKAKEALEQQKKRQGLVCWGLAFLIGTVGSSIKSVVWIALIAGFVWLALQCTKKQMFQMLFVAVVVCGLFGIVFQMRVNMWLGPEYREKAFPPEHWIMMGLVGDGSYNHADYLESSAIEHYEQRKEYAQKEILDRLQQRTPAEFWKFLQIKQLRSFGSGNADIHHFLEAGPKHQGIALQFGASYGQYHFVYEYFSQGWLVLMLFCLSGTGFFAMKNDAFKSLFGLPCGMIFGLWMFLLIWEAGQRYLIAGIPMMAFVMGCFLGQNKLFEKILKKEKKDG